jgi:hypothetical protein
MDSLVRIVETKRAPRPRLAFKHSGGAAAEVAMFSKQPLVSTAAQAEPPVDPMPGSQNPG